MNQIDLLCIGGVSADIILGVPAIPATGEKLLAKFISQQPGGIVSNTACAAARLGLRSAWAGTIGGDEYGRLILDGFEDFGVDTSLVSIEGELATDFTVILLDPSGERTILVVPTTPSPPRLHDEVYQACKISKVVYLPPYPPIWFKRTADPVHAGGGLVAVDVESSSPLKGRDLVQVMENTDLVFCNPRGLEHITGLTDPDKGSREVLKLGPVCVCVTLGENGAIVFTRNERVYQPGFDVPVIDTTGAGDCFHAAFINEYLAGRPLEETLRFANAAAALSIQHIGPRAGLPTRGEVLTFLRESDSD